MLGRQAAVAALGAALVVLASASEAASTKVPAWRSVAPDSLGVRFNLTSDWGVSTKAALEHGWEWEAFSPGRIAWLRMTSARTALSFDQIAATVVQRLRLSTEPAVRADRYGSFRRSRATVTGVPAVKVVIRGLQATAFGIQEATTVELAFVRAGVAYVIEFDSAQKFLSRFLPTLDRALTSMHLTQIA